MNIIVKYLKNIATVFTMAIFFISCEEDLTKNQGLGNRKFPSKTIYNANIIQRDSGFVKIRFKAPIIEEYEFIDTPYIEIKKGVYIEFYDKKKPNIPGRLWAKYAKIIEKKGWYEARGNVKVINNEGQSFVMQSIYWNKTSKQMFTKDTVFITDKDGSIFVAANGMKAKDDFSEYSFYNNSGNFNVEKNKLK